MPQIILASSSVYRKKLLERLLLEFTVVKPEMEEIRRESETAYDAADRLAEEKAKKVSNQFKEAIVIGCDQTAEYNNIQIQKPLDYERAVYQLQELSGKKVNFHSAICVNYSKKKIFQKKVISFNVKYKNLNLTEIESYLKKEQPFNCIGSIKSEGLGITLLDEINSSDPTAVIGLPLITLVGMLNKIGININGS
ncbi:Maf family nucleotide pyrophosphatase [Methylophilaceae bacterium]|nr:Maf family nucleotide pyrophosphatase [Methylophilaceae bacterium]